MEKTKMTPPLFLPLKHQETDKHDTNPYYVISSVQCTLQGTTISPEYNLVNDFIKEETRRRFKTYALNICQEGSKFNGFKLKEVLTSSAHHRLPNKLAEDEMFRQFPLLCLRRRDPADTDYTVIPLDEVDDLGCLAFKFFPLLKEHIKNVFGDSGRETLTEFSFFTALFVLGKAVDESKFAFSALLPTGPHDGQRESYEAVKELAMSCTAQWVRDAFIACQILRYMVVSVKNGFDYVIPSGDKQEGSPEPEYINALYRLEMTCTQMSVTQRTAYRMGMDELKVLYLCALSKIKSQVIPAEVFINLAHGGRSKARLTPASLYPFQSNVQLRIAPLTRVVTETKEMLRTLLQSSRSLDIVTAMANAKEKLSSGKTPEEWYLWNWNIGLFGEYARMIITGQMSMKRAQEMMGTGDDMEVTMFLALLGGKAFSLELSTSDYAAITGTQNEDSKPGNPGTQQYLVLCDSRNMTWDWEARLKDMYRLKKCWSAFELKEYIGPFLGPGAGTDLDSVIADCLEPSQTAPNMYQNLKLHLERP
eukprot:Blabericola_migrator_1__3350@NODE_198_length_11483_cov_213_989926_g171_i0_p3_GENE_NODE_198_length_11483_cov_213_989926_g171_i0NODE_198_length_11483_cov_213_989926_g171_i0_p3_ORF_typecomplete_len534_score115_22Dcc1/PF09724_9/1_4e03Dcc1/PF09724_9/0_27_NODE_198_length_11483_cov_213_989926_g171_i016473248